MVNHHRRREVNAALPAGVVKSFGFVVWRSENRDIFHQPILNQLGFFDVAEIQFAVFLIKFSDFLLAKFHPFRVLDVVKFDFQLILIALDMFGRNVRIL